MTSTMMITRRNPMTLPALALGLASVLLAPASLRAAPGGMQVEEPALGAPKPPIQPELDQEAWKPKRQAGLTAEQKAALKARQETMKDMMVLIQKKRLAIRDARPEQREALAQELHSLILEKGQSERGRPRAAGRKDSSPELSRPGQDDASGLDVNVRVRDARGKAADVKARQLELKEELLRQQEALRQEILRQQETRRQAWEEKLKQLEEKLKQKDEDD